MTSGGAIHDAGALGALIAYAVIGAMVFFLMTSLGEMATYLPVSGSFSTYATLCRSFTRFCFRMELLVQLGDNSSS